MAVLATLSMEKRISPETKAYVYICVFAIIFFQGAESSDSFDFESSHVETNIEEDIPNDEFKSISFEGRDFYTFDVEDASGKLVSLEQYRGKVVLVVNVASECGFTDGHYRALIRLRNVLSTSKKFEVLAFPCNQFGAQEPGSNAEIQDFVKNVYHVNFPVFAKVDVLGDRVPYAWQYLISSFGIAPNWNFWKYLVDEKGHVLNAWSPWTSVEDVFHNIKEVVDKIGERKPKFNAHNEL